jgi:putative hydrolase of the HAD superfamily
MITTLIFDWGGVLTVGRHTASIIRIIEKNNNLPEGSASFVVDEFMKPLNRNEVTFEQFTEGINQKLGINISLEEMEKIFDDAIIPNEELINSLIELKKRYRLILFSNNNEPTIEILRSKHNELLTLFDKVYFSAEFNTGKPKIDFFEIMITDTNIKPEESIFIDDKEKNVKASEEVGIKGILFENIEQLKKELVSLGISI